MISKNFDDIPPPLWVHEKVKVIKMAFSTILGDGCPTAPFQNQALTVLKSGHAYEYTSKRELSEAIFAADFPRLPVPHEVHHYTSLDSFKSIVASSTLQLSPVAKHLKAGEFTTFVKEHKLDGYQSLNNNRPIYEELSEDLFFSSFTAVDYEEEKLWDFFADEQRGVRLTLRLTPFAAVDLRKMAYQGKDETAIKKLNKLLAKDGLTFTPWTISRICAFYLGHRFSHESEIRLLIKRHSGGVNKAKVVNGETFWPVQVVPAGQVSADEFCKIELLCVTRAARCKEDTVRQAIAGTPFVNLPILSRKT